MLPRIDEHSPWRGTFYAAMLARTERELVRVDLVSCATHTAITMATEQPPQLLAWCETLEQYKQWFDDAACRRAFCFYTRRYRYYLYPGGGIRWDRPHLNFSKCGFHPPPAGVFDPRNK